MSEAALAAANKYRDTLTDIQRWHDSLIAFIEADEKARDVFHRDYREAVGMLSHLALTGLRRPPS